MRRQVTKRQTVGLLQYHERLTENHKRHQHRARSHGQMTAKTLTDVPDPWIKA
jgi:hypothetical protein